MVVVVVVAVVRGRGGGSWLCWVLGVLLVVPAAGWSSVWWSWLGFVEASSRTEHRQYS